MLAVIATGCRCRRSPRRWGVAADAACPTAQWLHHHRRKEANAGGAQWGWSRLEWTSCGTLSVIALRGFTDLASGSTKGSPACKPAIRFVSFSGEADSGCWLIGRFVLRERRSHISSCGSQREILDLPLCGVSRHARGPNPRLGFGFS